MRNRLLLVLVGVVALVLAIHDIPLAGHLNRVERDRLVTTLERDAFIIAGRAEEALEEGTAADEPALRALVARYSFEEDVRVAIVDRDATGVVASQAADLAEDFSNRPEFAQALGGEPTTDDRFSATLGEELFFVAVPVLSGDDVVGAVRISAPSRIVDDRASDRVRGLLFVALISLLIAIAVAWLFARTLAQPIRRLRLATDDLAAGDLGVRADDDDGPPEVRALATSFNSMAGRLEQLVDRQRAFAGTASHQLRTPLTALRLRLEQLADQVDSGQAETVDAALVETDRLHRMIEGLLALSRADDAAVGPVEVDVAAVVHDRAVYWTPLAAERGVTVVADAPETATGFAVAGATEQIIDNLVDNALEVSPDGSELILRLVPDDHHLELHVIDAGPGLSEEDRGAAFDRFWRGADAVPGGSGLGLAIVRQLAAAGDASTELREASTGGVDAVVTFRA
ncbi:MAG: HAMP domain-containing protein [Ilumatobacter sp.]|uniref:sensor histidine kinase n=1 Tax=Ilumatobacter sp. TaxID=1967498 RepID=UPI002638E518|nr:ATP-binding protein [Ilumatobacter sp.]MDJ0767835.1 HAMP domain-containing protein [Ilumatobacter sp.]